MSSCATSWPLVLKVGSDSKSSHLSCPWFYLPFHVSWQLKRCFICLTPPLLCSYCLPMLCLLCCIPFCVYLAMFLTSHCVCLTTSALLCLPHSIYLSMCALSCPLPLLHLPFCVCLALLGTIASRMLSVSDQKLGKVSLLDCWVW